MFESMKRLRPAKGVTRRDVVVGAGSIAAAVMVGLGKEIAFEEGYDAAKGLARPVGHSFVKVRLDNRFSALASDEQKIALEFWRMGRLVMPAAVSE